MKPTLAILLAVGMLAGCSHANSKAPDVTSDVRTSLDRAGLKDVTVSQDRDKGVVTLSGHVPSDADKAQAESAAKAVAGNEIVANEVVVTPPGNESDAKTVSSSLDDAMTNEIKAAFVKNHIPNSVDYDVKAGVVTLSGHTKTLAERTKATGLASHVANVTQVIDNVKVEK